MRNVFRGYFFEDGIKGNPSLGYFFEEEFRRNSFLECFFEGGEKVVCFLNGLITEQFTNNEN